MIAAAAVPRVGLLAAVRNRHGVVAAVQPFDGEDGRLHLVHLEYKDARQPADERLLWERETSARLVEPAALPDPSRDAMPPADFDALLRAARWNALVPYLDPDGDGPLRRMQFASPLHGAVRVEDYQLQPLLKALRMPRVSLLIADDVGLGKTIEAGLVLVELLIRRRIRRVLVLTPASLRAQWRDELKEKFALDFEVVDRQRTDAVRRELGMDANPWRSFDRIVASYHYLRQPDVLQRFLAACQTPDGSPHLPWDLLIVDECHNLMPSPVGEDSGLCRMLRALAPQFEHRLFLSATPHNGHTRSFTGLLEMLDPVRFSRTSELTPAMRGRVGDVLVRRLKRDIDAAGAGGSARRFCRRHRPQAIELAFDARERELAAAFAAFRQAIRRVVADDAHGRRRAGHFAVEILGKRLLSCSTAFAESWRRARQGLTEAPADAAALAAAERAWRQETGDDRETEHRSAIAATVAGAWLANYAGEADWVQGEVQRIEQALDGLGFDLAGAAITEQTPRADARFDALAALIDRLLLADGDFREDERLIVFTEYKTTLDYLARRLCERFDPQRILTLFGAGGSDGMTATDREQVKAAFNDAEAPVRILVATDAASEGLNLHRTARYLLHYDCPWNPSRLEQRNGRLDRYGQSRDVTVHHFVSDADDDLRFLDHVITKADGIREDLGTVNELFDRAAHRRLIEGHDLAAVRTELDASLTERLGTTGINADAAVTPAAESADSEDEAAALEALKAEADLHPQALGDTLEAALAATGGRPQLRRGGEPGFHRLLRPDLPGWRDVVDASVRIGGQHGPVPQLAFSAESFVRRIGDLRVFLPRHDALLLHLSHPLMRRALGVLARRRYPGERQVSRWTARRGEVPAGAQAVILLSVEELAVNALRETFHCWMRTVAFPVQSGALGQPLPHAWSRQHRDGDTVDADGLERAADLLEDANAHLRDWLAQYETELTGRLRGQLEADLEVARKREDERFRQRQGEVSTLIEQSTLARLTREVEALAIKRRQGQLFDEAGQLAAIERSAEEKRQELARRRQHYEELRDQLQRERARTQGQLLPKRFTLAGAAQVFPVTVEVRLAE